MATATATKITIRPLGRPGINQTYRCAKEKTKHGIYLPEGAQEKPMSGKVIATGPGKLNDEGKRADICVKKGDTIVYGKYSGTEIEIDGDNLVILRENELLGVLEK